MSAPFLWIILPIFVSVFLWFFRRNRDFTFLCALGISSVLTILAALFPIDRLVSFSFFSANLSSSFNILGRSLVLVDSERSFLVLAFGMTTLWIMMAWLGKTRRIFAPISTMMIALLIAGIAVQPFFYSALILEVAILLSILLLYIPGQRSTQGVLRFLIHQTFAVPCILIIGWLTEIAGTNPADPTLSNLMALFVSLGFAFWLAVFPFYSWLPMLSEESDPMMGGFVLGMLPSFILFLLLRFVDGFVWLRDQTLVFSVFQIAGIIMIITGGIWAAFENKLTRLFSYMVIMETGFALISLSMRNRIGLQIFVSSMFPRMLAFAIWAFTMTLVERKKINLDLEGVKGLFWKTPWLSLGLLTAMASLSGIPLLATFIPRLLLFQSLIQHLGNSIFWISVSSLVFLVAFFRVANCIFQKPESNEHLSMGRYSLILIIFLAFLLLLIGLFPKLFYYGSDQLLKTFQHLNW